MNVSRSVPVLALLLLAPCAFAQKTITPTSPPPAQQTPGVETTADGRRTLNMSRYRDLPMDLADASLVILAEDLSEGRILSTDQRDFDGYRWKNRRPFTNLLL